MTKQDVDEVSWKQGKIWVFPENGGFSPQIIHFDRVFHYFHHPFWGPTPIFGNTHMEHIIGLLYNLFWNIPDLNGNLFS